MGLEGLFSWFQTQVKYALFIVLFILLIATAYKRAWLALVGAIVMLSFLAIFVIKPDMLISIGSWLSDILKLGKK